tara:strand:+ start:2611 stop:3408 length:798 start_codon:yes stop_codon:yes gene_type:complete
MLSVIRTGLDAATREIAVVSNNIANSAATGFKKSFSSFEDQYTENLTSTVNDQVGRGTRFVAPRRMHSQGALKQTGSALDLAVVGQGMFVLNTLPQTGNTSFTRDGSINISATGQLVNSDGIAYLGTNEANTTQFPIQLPFTRISEDGLEQRLTKVEVDPSGKIMGTYGLKENVFIAQVLMAKFTNESRLKQVSNGLYEANNGSGFPTYGVGQAQGFGQIQAGAIETSNIDITTELSTLIRAQQAFNGNAKLLQAENKVLSGLMK